MSLFKLQRLWAYPECKNILRSCQESKKTQWPSQEQELPKKNEVFQAHVAMATPRVLKDPKARPTAQQVQKNEVFQAHEDMTIPRG